MKERKLTEEGLKKWQESLPKEAAAKRGGSFKTISGKSLKALYTPLDTEGLDYLKELSFPGQYPFTRGAQADMYRGRLWTMRQFSGFGDAAASNERYRYLLSQGQTGLSVAFDMPTIMGYDSDHSLAAGEVGRCGVAIDSLADMETLFKGIRVDQVSTSMTINAPAAIVWAFYLVNAQKQGVGLNKISGTIQNDILKEYMAQKSWIFPPEPSLRLITDVLAFAAENTPRFNPISISGYHIREAGSTAVQELAYTLANGFAYVEAALASGLDIDSFAPRLSFFFNAHLDFFEEIAKFRAARKIWARHMKERFQAKDERSWRLRFHTQTAGSSLTAQEPENNLTRTAIEALAAVLGGTQSLHTNAMDEALALPTAKAALLALRTQQIIAFESGVAGVIDPLAGSYFVEALTKQMEEEAEEIFSEIERFGGVLKALAEGYFQKEIAGAASNYQRAVENEERIVVGVNRYESCEEPAVELLKIDQAAEEQQIASLKALKKQRNERQVQESLAALSRAAGGAQNLMPKIIECAKLYVTLGEMVAALKTKFGEYKEKPIF